MKSPKDIWGELGELPGEEAMHVLTKLFAVYEERLKLNSGDQQARQFLINLDNAITLTSGCNLNRR